MMMFGPNTPTPSTTPWARVGAVVLVAGLALTVLVLAFTWPTKTAEPRNFPLAVAGPEQVTSTIAEQLEATGTFDVVEVPDREAAVALVHEREIYGAVVLSPAAPPEVLIASAAGPSTVQVLNGLAAQLEAQATEQMQGQAQPTVTITDLVPLAADDRTGAGLGVTALPLAFGGILGGVLTSLALAGVWRKLIGVLAYGAVGGLLVTLILHTWFGYLQGSFGSAWLAVSLGLAATSYVVAGLHALLGYPGLGLAAAFTVLVANPLSGATLPWQFIAEPWGAIGQFLIPGASNSLLRVLSYFPDANTMPQWVILIAWAAAGALLLLIGGLRAQRSSAPAHQPNAVS